ncbi:hypothetical protein FVQ98_03695 [Ottowia sp. GY511]|uniref:Uncharacterized protein n=1 Tax=Ottowia flava TaxID=2675430 RepID=A0ABW4KU74_9BURK|nr:hypothetical protein [Ottowia sp. GY511]TXK33096.1 hypothetical protein FVQ98_03695 [Ottowia sp. GY511]
MLYRTTSAVTLMLALAAANSASAQTPSPAARSAEFDRTFAVMMLPVRQATLNACLKHFPQSSPGIQAEWNAQMANPELKAQTQTPAFQQEVASFDPKIAEQMSTPTGRKEMENACRGGIGQGK